MKTEDGKRFVQVGGDWKEAVLATSSDIAKLPDTELKEGAYLVGTGNTGAAGTFMTLGVVYFLVMMVASFSYRVPAADWRPDGWEPPTNTESSKKMITTGNVDMDQALKTPQFYFMWIVLCFNVTAGIGVIGVAKTMMNEIFGTTLPNVVNGAFAATYVLMISVFNMLGRIIWASASDYIGRKNTYHCFFVLGTLLYLSIPWTAGQVSASPAVTWLVMFYGATMIIFTMYGGGFATIPAYLADIFGMRFVGAIHGRLLTAWSTAGVLGPLAITKLRQASVDDSIRDLATKVDDRLFIQTFGAGKDQIESLMAAKTVTVSKLMSIVPDGTIDPTSGLYNSTMYAMAALLVVAFFANLAIKPVASHHHIKGETN
jgi:hypothetical protein